MDLGYRARITPSDLRPGLLNVVVFGPGRGEATLIVFPDGSLGVVDGCREQGDPVDELVEELGNQRTIRFVCLTHPHDDHYAGLGAFVERHRDRIEKLATVPMLSDRRTSSKLKKMVRQSTARSDPSRPTYTGLDKIIRQVLQSTQARSPVEPVHLTDYSPLVAPTGFGDDEFEAFGVAPSSSDAALAGQAVLKDTHFDPNRASAALVVRFGESRVLLTGDLVKRTAETARFRGWRAATRWLGAGSFQVVKAAHHASEKAHSEDLWRGWKAEVVIVTPFQRAQNNQPPKRSDLMRLATVASHVAVTSPPAWLEADPARDPLCRVPPEQHADRHNAVHCALDARGDLIALTLANRARRHDEAGDPISPPKG